MTVKETVGKSLQSPVCCVQYILLVLWFHFCRQSLPDDCMTCFDKETLLLEAPMIIKVADQVSFSLFSCVFVLYVFVCLSVLLHDCLDAQSEKRQTCCFVITWILTKICQSFGCLYLYFHVPKLLTKHNPSY